MNFISWRWSFAITGLCISQFHLNPAPSRGVQNLQMPQPQDWQDGQMPRSSLAGEGGGGGCWVQVELTDALDWV